MRREWMTAEQQEYWSVRDRIEGGGTCCEQGARVHCVCRAASTCPVHGSICIGSHD
jgi:hypothetical protein